MATAISSRDLQANFVSLLVVAQLSVQSWCQSIEGYSFWARRIGMHYPSQWLTNPHVNAEATNRIGLFIASAIWLPSPPRAFLSSSNLCDIDQGFMLGPKKLMGDELSLPLGDLYILSLNFSWQTSAYCSNSTGVRKIYRTAGITTFQFKRASFQNKSNPEK